MTKTAHKIPIETKPDFLERLGKTTPLQAVAELIWNGLDAGAELVEIGVVANAINGVEEVTVKDCGTGIPFNEVEHLFGNLGDSWKKRENRKFGRALHGKNGQGRFKAFTLGHHVRWRTIVEIDGKLMTYDISGSSSALNDMSFTDPVPAKASGTGTVVIIDQIDASLSPLCRDEAPHELAKIFAAYLSQYPRVGITLNGIDVDPTELQSRTREISLPGIRVKDGRSVDAAVKIVEWIDQTKRAIHLCDSGGISLHEMEPGIQAPGFHFTAYIKCDHLRELDKENMLRLEELDPDVKAIVSAGKEAIRAYFRRRQAERQRDIVDQWKAEKIYPYEEKEDLTPVEEAERQVFDIVAVNLENYLPKFDEAEKGSRKFTFRLLAQALRDNPESVQTVLTEVLQLKQEEQDDLAALLENTSLSNIIKSATTVADRINFLIGLENLLFDKETKKKLLERDQLHKILENEAWIFDEQFALSGSEERLEEVLALHLEKLGQREDEGPVVREEDKQGRVDLMLSRVVQPRHDERDHLIVELKRPSQKINSEILVQVESYAIAVAKDPRFLKEKTRWRFIVVSNEIDEHAQRKARQRQRKPGLVFDDAELNIEVWAFDWTEIIGNARTRLQFINESLCYEANRESAREYLMKAHAKFIPEVDNNEPDSAEVSAVENESSSASEA